MSTAPSAEEEALSSAAGTDHQISFQRLEIADEPSQASLPRLDGGFAAWSYLAAATGLETLVWGLTNSYGVFLAHYEPIFHSSPLLPVVGTIAMGSMYILLSPLTLYLSSKPHLRPWTMWVGLLILSAGMIGAAFATSPVQLLGTQGIMYGIGGTMLYCPVTSYMFEWWRYRRGMATGVMFSGTGLGGLVMPFVSSALLQRYGRKTTLISLAVGYVFLLSLLIPFIRPRLPLPAKTHRAAPKIDWLFLNHQAFWLLFLGVLSQGLAAFIPSTYIPSYASTLSLPASTGTVSVALMNLARVPGQVILGWISDRVAPRKLIMLMAAGSSLSVFAGWGEAKSTGALLGFSLAFGTFAGSYTALFPRFIEVIAKDDPHLPQILYAFFSFARGLGSVLSGPISSSLLSLDSQVYGMKGYGVLVLWTGAALATSGIAAGYNGLKRE
ncbi:hypothetical protein P7C73_g3793, partial [Tremellales sp. Uapishka_1]